MTTAGKIRFAALAARLVRGLRASAGRPPIDVFHRGGLRWELDLRQGIDFAIYLLGGFEPRTLRDYARLVRPGDTVIDVGANLGAHTLPLARLVGPAGRVVAFEPTDYAFGRLLRNLALNPEISPRVTPVQSLVVADPAAAKPTSLPASWSLLPLSPGQPVHPVHRGTLHPLASASAVRLDDWVRNSGMARIDLLKLDVDGAELDVLAGAAELLARHRPRLLLEFAPYLLRERGRSPAELGPMLRPLGYRARLSGRDARELPAFWDLALPPGGSVNLWLEAS